MTATRGQIRTAIADTFAAALPTVNAERLPVDSVQPPALVVVGFDDEPSTMAGGTTARVEVWAVVSRRHVDQMDVLDALCDPNDPASAYAAIAGDPTLGGVVSSCVVTGSGDYREIAYGSVSFYAATIGLEVLL